MYSSNNLQCNNHKIMNMITTQLAVVGVTVFGAAGANLIEDQHISIATVGTVGFIAFGLTWAAGRMWQKVMDRLEKIEDKMDNLPCLINSQDNGKDASCPAAITVEHERKPAPKAHPAHPRC